jgi:orotate phosphoribosyltransferase
LHYPHCTILSLTNRSTRISPYFFNAGLLATGPLLATVAQAYASTITTAQRPPPSTSPPAPPPFPTFDVLFGPAYKGIPFAACTALTLSSGHNQHVGFAYDRKEAKDHGEGGSLVGAPVRGKRIVIIDDVMTSGTAVRVAIDKVTKEGGVVVGVVQLLDREEIGLDGRASTVGETAELVGGEGRVRSILRMRDLMQWLEDNGRNEELASMQAYWEKYGMRV